MTLTVRLALAMITLVAITASAVGWLSHRRLEQDILPRVLDRIEAHSRLVAFDLESHVRGARGDLAAFRATAALNGLIRARLAGGTDPVDGLSEQTWRERTAAQLIAELEAKPAYAQFRIIGIEDGGREIIRAERSASRGGIRLVPEAELRQQGDRPYFKETIGLPATDFYVSDLDLSPRRGVIGLRRGAVETPYVPTLRVGAPLRGPDGNPFGVIIINVDMRPAFDRVRASVRPGSDIYVVGKLGDYLVHPDRTREFGSDLGQPFDWRKDFPALASRVGEAQSIALAVPDAAGQSDGVSLAPALLAEREWIGVIETVPNASFVGPAVTIRNTALGVGLIAIFSAAALAILLARSLARPIVQLTEAVENVAQKGLRSIPVNAAGETGVLARAFARVMNEVNVKTAALEREVVEHLRTEAARDRHAERERLFGAAVESSNDAVITSSLDGVITGWNPAAERLFGYAAAEAVGRHISLIVPPDRLREVDDSIRRIRSGERIESSETVRLRRDGAPVEVSLSISPIKTASGAILGISKTVRDVSERNRTQKTLLQQAEQLRRIFETSQDLLLVLDSRGRVVQVSDSCRAIVGYRADEMIGRAGEEVIHPDDLERFRAELRAARRGERMKLSSTRCAHKDGHPVWLSWLGAWSEPVKQYYFVGRDMTESRKAQESLRESEQMARGVIDTAIDAFLRVDQRGIVQGWNPQAETMFGWPRAEAIGKNAFELLALNPAQSPLKVALERFLQSGVDQVAEPRREIAVKRRDGSEFIAELSVTALRTRDGFVFNAFVRDLTEKIAAEERIRQFEKMEAMGQLTGGIAHDFNNILTVITGTIEILADAVKGEPQLAAITKMIDEAATRGAALTQHLLAFARKQPLEPREIDVNLLIIETAKLLQRTLGEHVEIDAVFEDETCPAIVDPNQFATAILNLALNARDAMPDGGKLVIETGSVVLDQSYSDSHSDVRPGRYALIAISDTGVGIPADIIDKVFNPFFTSKGPGKGTGLGLSMVYGFIKQSSGHIKIYSEEGQGTTVKMYLPPATGTALAVETTAMPAPEGGHETILVVEDDKLVRDYVLTQLHALGYVTLEAANAVEALAIVRSGRAFDLLFTDVIMPGINGRQLTEEIERLKPGMKVLFTSGYTENAIIHHGRLDEGVLLLAKPYRKSDMAKMIRKALGE